MPQIIVGGVADTPGDVRIYASCTLLAATQREEDVDPERRDPGAIEACVEWLLRNEFAQVMEEERDGKKGNGRHDPSPHYLPPYDHYRVRPDVSLGR